MNFNHKTNFLFFYFKTLRKSLPKLTYSIPYILAKFLHDIFFRCFFSSIIELGHVLYYIENTEIHYLNVIYNVNALQAYPKTVLCC